MKCFSGKKRTAGVLLSLLLLFTGVLPAQAAKAEGIEVVIPVAQKFTVSGTSSPSENEFIYEFTRLEEENPMPGGSGEDRLTFRLSGSREISLAPIEFLHAGVYSYEIKLTGTEKEGYHYDHEVYTVSIFVRNVDSGLEADMIVQQEDGEKASDILFENGYDDGTGRPVQTGDSSESLWTFLLAAILAVLAMLASYRKIGYSHRE